MQDTVLHLTKPFLLLAAMLPLLYAEACRITKFLNAVQDKYTQIMFADPETDVESKDKMKLLDNFRIKLRRVLEVTEDLLGQFPRYLGSQIHSNVSEQRLYVDIVAELRSLIANARRLEAEVRDFKQVQIGDLALEESHKAIELSNAQIREAKSGRFGKEICVDYADST